MSENKIITLSLEEACRVDKSNAEQVTITRIKTEYHLGQWVLIPWSNRTERLFKIINIDNHPIYQFTTLILEPVSPEEYSELRSVRV